jgi:putative addiction module killer protein
VLVVKVVFNSEVYFTSGEHKGMGEASRLGIPALPYPTRYNQTVRVETTKVYLDWINSMNDRVGRARIQVRVDRLVHGNPGQHRSLTDGVYELKIDFGPGYRVYYTQRDGVVIVLLAGGDKSSQQKDIKTAISLAKGLKEHFYGKSNF